MRLQAPEIGCERCRNGYIDIIKDGEVVGHVCECLERRMLFSYLGNRLYSAVPEVAHSVLFNAAGDKTTEDLIIHGDPGLVDRHLRWVLRHKHRHTNGSYRYRLTSDDQILNAFLGKAAGEGDATFESVEELVGDPNLVLIQLGIHQARNRVLADEIMHACSIRQSKGMPTWILEGHYKLEPGHRCWSERLERHIEQRFERVRLGEEVAQPMEVATFEPPNEPHAEWTKPKAQRKRTPKNGRFELNDAFEGASDDDG